MPDIDLVSMKLVFPWLAGRSVNQIKLEFNTALFVNLDGLQVRFGSRSYGDGGKAGTVVVGQKTDGGPP
jgi:hypothetical protein